MAQVTPSPPPELNSHSCSCFDTTPLRSNSVLTGVWCSEDVRKIVTRVKGICHSVVSRIAPHRVHTDEKPNAPKKAEPASNRATTTTTRAMRLFRRAGLVLIVRDAWKPPND